MRKNQGRWRRFWGLHLSVGLSESDSRPFRITNIVQLIFFIMPTLLIPQVNFVEPPETRFLSNMNYIGLVTALIVCRVLLFRYKITLSATITLLAINIHIALLCISAADEPGYMGFIIMAVLPMLMLPRQNRLTRWIMVILPAILFLAHQYYYRVLAGSGIYGPPKWVMPADYLMPPLVLLFALLILVIYQFVKAVNIAEEKLNEEYKKSEELLANIIPEEIVSELKEKGSSEPRYFSSATVCFTDFQGFTTIAESLSPSELVKELDNCFSYFDSLMERHHLEKLKTIGDSYMFAGGIPIANSTHAVDCVMAALEIQKFMKQMKEIKASQGLPYWELRLGIHSGDLIAGVIGEKKFAYDVWSDTVNTASRCESSGAVGQVNISYQTYELVKNFFECEHRGSISAKNKGEIDMYFVTSLKAELQHSENRGVPNDEFDRLYAQLEKSQ